jgi:O-antigen/teichoic acid export membrane protein
MRARPRETTALAIGSVANGLLAYVFYALATRQLGADDAAPLAVLWTYWSFAGAALTFPLQHWITRSVGAHRGAGAVRAALPSVAGLAVVASLAAGVLAWLVRDELFRREDAWFPALVMWVTLGSAFTGVVRGGLAARLRFGSVGLALAAENALRCAAALVLVVAGVRSSVGFGICLALGSLVGLLWPSSWRFGQDPAEAAARTVESPYGFLGAAAGGQLLGQALLTGGPVVLALSGGTAAQVTALFAGLALFRAPYTLAIGLVSALTGRLTVLVVAGRQRALRTVRTAVVAGTAAATLVAAAIGAAAGPALVRLVFGPEVRLDGASAALVAAGSALALGNLVLTIVTIARSRSAALTMAWVLAVAGGAVPFLAVPEPALARVCWAFVTAEAVAFAALLITEVRSGRAAAGARSIGS